MELCEKDCGIVCGCRIGSDDVKKERDGEIVRLRVFGCERSIEGEEICVKRHGQVDCAVVDGRVGKY